MKIESVLALLHYPFWLESWIRLWTQFVLRANKLKSAPESASVYSFKSTTPCAHDQLILIYQSDKSFNLKMIRFPYLAAQLCYRKV